MTTKTKKEGNVNNSSNLPEVEVMDATQTKGKVWIFGKPETIWLQKFDSFLSSKFAEVLKDKLLLIVLLFDYIGTNEKFECLRHTLKT